MKLVNGHCGFQQFPGCGISGNDPGSGKWFPVSNSRSTKFYVEKRKKYILSAIEIYKNRLKVWNKHHTIYKIAVNRLSHSYDWKFIIDNMWYVWSKLISEGGIKRDGNSREIYTGNRESKRELLQYSSGHEHCFCRVAMIHWPGVFYTVQNCTLYKFTNYKIWFTGQGRGLGQVR